MAPARSVQRLKEGGMKENSMFGRRFERLILGLGMSLVLLVLEWRVMKMQRAAGPRDARELDRL
jgi:hypothetical protein